MACGSAPHYSRSWAKPLRLGLTATIVWSFLLLSSVVAGCRVGLPSGVGRNSAPAPARSAESTPSARGEPAKWRGPLGPVSLEEAQRHVTFRILLPRYLPKGVRRVEVRLQHPGVFSVKNIGRVELTYTKGVNIQQEGLDGRWLPWYMVDRLNSPEAGVSSERNPWIKVMMKRGKAMAHEPSKSNSTAVLSWWENGVRYTTYGEKTSLHALINIAESMK